MHELKTRILDKREYKLVDNERDISESKDGVGPEDGGESVQFLREFESEKRGDIDRGEQQWEVRGDQPRTRVHQQSGQLWINREFQDLYAEHESGGSLRRLVSQRWGQAECASVREGSVRPKSRADRNGHSESQRGETGEIAGDRNGAAESEMRHHHGRECGQPDHGTTRVHPR